MSVIGRIEVANFLNLDNIKPNEEGWTPNYPHLVINCRGTNTIIQLDNGGGKSTLSHGILALLSRHRTSIERVRDILAPKRQGIYTHIRIEVRYRDNLAPLLPGTIDDIPGEPYVIGLYGYHDKSESLSFYIYQGTFEDCPVAHTSLSDDGELRIEFEKNAVFTERLKKQRHWENRTRAEYLSEVHQHFDEKLVDHMVQYQLLGGGDGNSNFFSLKKRAGEEFSTTFFYEHLAPEVLVDCMGVAAEEDERAFEDTLIHSARKVIDIELRQKDADRNVDSLNYTYNWLRNCASEVSDYEAKREDINTTFTSLWHELKFVEDVVVTQPLTCIPAPIENAQDALSLKVANNLVCKEGEWLVPDGLIAQLTHGLEIKRVNEHAVRNSIANFRIKQSQVIEIPCDLGISVKQGRHETKAYTLANALKLFDSIGDSYFSEDVDRNAVKRAVNFGYTARLNAPEFNPFRAEEKVIKSRIEELDQNIEHAKQTIKDSEQEDGQLSEQLKHFDAAESAYTAMRESGDFTEEQLAAPLQTEKQVKQDQAESVKKRDDLIQRKLELESEREHYRRVKSEFGSEDCPEEILAELKAEESRLSEQRDALLNEISQLNAQIDDGETQLNKMQAKVSGLESEKSELGRFSYGYDVVAEEYTDSEITGLSARLEGNQRKSQIALIEAKSALSESELKYDYLSALAEDYHEFQSRFGERPARGLRSKLESERTHLESDSQGKRLQLKLHREKHDNLALLRPGYETAQETFRGLNLPVAEVAGYLKDQSHALATARDEAQRTIDEMTPLAAAQCRFLAEYSVSIDDAISQHKAHLRTLQTKCYQLEEELTGYNEKRRLYENVGLAPQSLSEKALKTLNFNGLTVHEVIDGLNVSKADKKAMLTAFSQLLHAPVVESREEAQQMVTRLNQADMDYPVFVREVLVSWTTERPADVTDLLIGQESLQVKAILDPEYLPQLIAQISEKIHNSETELDAVRTEISVYGLEAERYRFLSTARAGIEKGAAEALELSEKQLSKLDAEIAGNDALMNHPAYAMLSQAVQYLNDGGDTELSRLDEEMSLLSEQIAENELRFKMLAEQLTADNIHLLDQAEKFEAEGGEARCLALQRDLVALQTAVTEAERVQRTANECYGKYFQHAKEAEHFLSSGGHTRLNELKTTLTELTESVDELKKAISHSKKKRKAVEQNRGVLTDKAYAAGTRVAQWEVGLLSAQRFIDADGIEFDRTYNDQLTAISTRQSLYQRQLQNMFGLAQQYIDSKTKDRSREQLIAQLDACRTRLKMARTELNDHQQERNESQDNLVSLALSAKTFDDLAIKLIQRYKETAEILANMQDEAVVTDAETSPYLETAVQIADEFREMASGEDRKSTLTRLDELTDITGYFEFSARDKELKHKVGQLKAQLSAITKSVMTQCRADTGLKEGERNELSDKSNEAIFPVIRSFRDNYQLLVHDAERKRAALSQDVQQQQDNLTDALIALSRNLEDNFELMKNILKPGRAAAGFFIEAEVVSSRDIRTRIEVLIENIRAKESARRTYLETEKSTGMRGESDKEYMEGLKKYVRENFYRTIFTGKEGKKDEGAPKVSFQHPCLNAGRRKMMSSHYSTGQKTALSLLLLTKLAQFAGERDAHSGLIMRSRSRAKKTPSNKVVLIDGLFSNLSSPELIEFSLETVRMMKDQFQLIGWVHNPHYQNNHEIFPTFYAIRRVDNQGMVMRAKDLSQGPTMMASAALFIDRELANESC